MLPPGCSLGAGKKIQNYSCRRLALARIYHALRICVLCSSKAREVQVMSSFENNQSDIDVCVSLSTLCILPKITHNYNMSLLKNTNSGPMFLLSAAFRLQLKPLSCRRDGSSSRISSSLILQNLMELIGCLWLPSAFSKTKSGRTDDLCVLPKCCPLRDMGLSKTT
jgi:hypothetical protein